ncbi:hypothetical protein KO561_09165 [Radiobacillus kanasensis]|uniref:hypothetical protein n=1 Tax=Radiobacillus kanasensis TaxID=2844358 RepID=UPI001E43D7D2|nr:hypothetical protein [Radiobacillus kanasensis]UFU01084.1 hypothetical protein KO561_09165 [Radiobacillus kanasensis]
MSKYSWLSLILFIGSVFFFFLFKGPNADLLLGVIVFGVLSIAGIICSILTKRWAWIIGGGLVHGGVLGFSYTLLLAGGIAGF